jgi:leucyl/phenylalanyl-tRNA--protein transferase
MLDGYRHGLFPMGVDGELGWWSPNPRGVFRPTAFHTSRSLRRQRKKLSVSVDVAFTEVVRGCADPGREHGWITEEFVQAYCELFDLGWAHSIEVWVGEPGGGSRLAGGLFGVEVGGLFAAESMFHRVSGASKVAVGALCSLMAAADPDRRRLIDVQWCTAHLASLGAITMPRDDYLVALAGALALPNAL